LANPGDGTIIAMMSDARVQGLLDLAKRLATEAAAIALPRLGKVAVRRKPDDSVVTETDHAIQGHVLDAVAGSYPDHAVCAEETLMRPSDFTSPTHARYCWVVDPLDGTRNYASGLPCFSTSLAVLDYGRPIIGVVFEHNLKWLYAAGAGLGATCNNAPIHVEENPANSDMLVGIPSSKDQQTVNVLRDWVATPGLVCRNLGSIALHLSFVASGALAAAFCKRSKIWDIAAGALLVSEAGGRITDLSGVDWMSFDLAVDPNEDLPILAAAPKTHQRLLASIQAATR